MDRPLSLLDAAGVLPHVPVGPAEGAAGVAPQVGGVDGPADHPLVDLPPEAAGRAIYSPHLGPAAS